MNWQTKNTLPDAEPNPQNRTQYAEPQLLAGASEDGKFAYDAVWMEIEECFALTFLWLNDEFGFVEDERRLYPTTRAELLQNVADFEANPQEFFD